MRISELAEYTGVPATTLRFYEGAGLLHAERTPAKYRDYGVDAVERLGFIRATKGLGLSLEEIGELLPVWERGACDEVKSGLVPRVRGRLEDAERRLTKLREFVASLQVALRRIEESSGGAGACDSDCGCLGPTATVPNDPDCRRSGIAAGIAADSDHGGFEPASAALVASLGRHPWPTGELAADSCPGCRVESAREVAAGSGCNEPPVGTRADNASPGAATDAAAAGLEPGASVEVSCGPIACSLDAGNMAARIGDWRTVLHDVARTPTSGGVAMSVPVDRAEAIAELIVAEQKCCPFLDFRLHFRGDVLEFEVGAPTEASSLLARVFQRPDRCG